MKAIDLTGKRFGRLTVIKFVGYTKAKRKNRLWECKCDCGNIAIRTDKALKSSKNSGCNNCKFVYEDLTGQKFGYLTVQSFTKNKRGQLVWNCICKCGNTCQAKTTLLKNGHIVSCGCKKRENIIARNRSKTTPDDLSKTRLYKIWCSIKKRCCNPNSISFKNYGGRGISICDKWKNNFGEFYRWSIANGYQDELTIERIDVNGNYCPENCCWITLSKQARNQRKTIRYTICGIEKPLIEWSEYAGISYYAVYQRYHFGKEPFLKNELKMIEEKIRSEENG